MKLQQGDTIKCHDSEDAIRTDRELIQGGYVTDFLYEKDGQTGIWIEILGTEGEKHEME